jgi:hypothetical protein
MKKTIVYAAIAIMLGVAIMMLPLALLTGLKTVSQPPFIQPARTNGLTPQVPSEQIYGVIAQPFNLLPSSIVTISGLVIALAVYVVFKKRTD